jgi:hypothetical protein
MDDIEGVETDFGFVPYSIKTRNYLDMYAAHRWSKRKSKKREASRKLLDRVAAAVMIAATIEYAATGRILEEF